MESEKPEEHDPFCEIDFDGEFKKSKERIAKTAHNMLVNIKDQMQTYMKANNLTLLCLHLDVNIEGKYDYKLTPKYDIKKTLDEIELGHSQEVQ